MDLIRTIANGTEHAIGLDAKLGDAYPNAVIWNPSDGNRGIEIAYLEGHGNVGGLVTIVGFDTSSRMTVREIPGTLVSMTGTDRSLVRCATGSVAPEDLRFMMFRTPIDRFPYTDMTDAEKDAYNEWVDDGMPVRKDFISRGMTFENFRARPPKKGDQEEGLEQKKAAA